MHKDPNTYTSTLAFEHNCNKSEIGGAMYENKIATNIRMKQQDNNFVKKKSIGNQNESFS